MTRARVASPGSVTLHGTRASSAESILRDLLEPRRPRHWSWWEPSGVYLTCHLPTARAAGQAASGGAGAAVLVIEAGGLPLIEQRVALPFTPRHWGPEARLYHVCPELIPPERLSMWGSPPYAELRAGRVSFEDDPAPGLRAPTLRREPRPPRTPRSRWGQ